MRIRGLHKLGDVLKQKPRFTGIVNCRGIIYIRYKNGVRHKLDGPAYEGMSEGLWYINGNGAKAKSMVRLNAILWEYQNDI